MKVSYRRPLGQGWRRAFSGARGISGSTARPASSPPPREAAPETVRAAARPAARAAARRLAALLVPLVALACGPTDEGPGADARPGEGGPSLVVMVVVDQLRGDLLERYDAHFTGGFRRLLDQGMVYTGASHRHAYTETAPGHATLATGVHPARHGIVANAFSELQDDGTLRGRYAVGDTASPLLGYPEAEGRSPATLLADGLADWVLAADTAARVVSISKKDRSAVTMGGRQSDERVHVYWLNVPSRRFVTSEFYRSAYPNWLERFNRERVPALLSDSVWQNTAPEAARALARPDPAPYEGDGEHTTFPHLRSVEAPGESRALGWAEGTPFPDAALLALAEAALDELELGRRGAVDLLALGFSQADYVGHGYGPLSQEQLDNLIRLDAVLGRLLTLLDERVGAGRWVLGLSADHGVLTMPEHLASQGLEGFRTPSYARDSLAWRLQEALAPGLDAEEARRRIREVVEAEPYVARVLDPSELEAEPPADSFAVLYRNSYRPDRRRDALALAEHDLLVRPEPFWLVTSWPQGTTHGSPYWYDRHVPFVLLGAGVEAGRSEEPVWTVDFAPTLARFVGIGIPPGLDGVPRGGAP